MAFALLSLLVSASPADAGAERVAAARAVANELSAKKFDAVVARFAPAMASLTAASLGAQWSELTQRLGAFRQLGGAQEEPDRAVVVECVYENASLHVRVTFDESLRIVGLRPAPGQRLETFETAGRDVVTELSTGAFAKTFARFSAPMAKALPTEKLEQVWKDTVAKAGAFRRIEAVEVDPGHPPFTLVDLSCTFEKTTLVLRVVFDGALKMGGFFIRPGWTPPPYADASTFEERTVTVGTKALPLTGTLTLPKGKGPFPAVVLVHGSGPNDADESIGPNKPFRDLAYGLASRKVAVLRYPKRTFAHRGKLSDADIATVKEESIDDALAAVALLAGLKEVDGKRLFVIGHSLGASLAPRIATADARVRGLVLLAGATRKPWHLVVEQRKYLAQQSPQSGITPESIRQAEENAKRLDDPALSPTDEVDGLPGRYWLDLRQHDDVAIAAKLGRPMLVLQGERDYQVTMTDFAGWKKALGGKKNVTLKSYPALNHAFMPGTGASTPAEYQVPGHVPVEVVDDIAKWLTTH